MASSVSTRRRKSRSSWLGGASLVTSSLAAVVVVVVRPAQFTFCCCCCSFANALHTKHPFTYTRTCFCSFWPSPPRCDVSRTCVIDDRFLWRPRSFHFWQTCAQLVSCSSTVRLHQGESEINLDKFWECNKFNLRFGNCNHALDVLWHSLLNFKDYYHYKIFTNWI